MLRLPTLISPAVYVRRRALYDGVLGSSTLWKLVAAAVFGRSVLRRVLGRHPEHLSVERLRPGQSVQVIALGPRGSRRQRRQAARWSDG